MAADLDPQVLCLDSKVLAPRPRAPFLALLPLVVHAPPVRQWVTATPASGTDLLGTRIVGFLRGSGIGSQLPLACPRR